MAPAAPRLSTLLGRSPFLAGVFAFCWLFACSSDDKNGEEGSAGSAPTNEGGSIPASVGGEAGSPAAGGSAPSNGGSSAQGGVTEKGGAAPQGGNGMGGRPPGAGGSLLTGGSPAGGGGNSGAPVGQGGGLASGGAAPANGGTAPGGGGVMVGAGGEVAGTTALGGNPGNGGMPPGGGGSGDAGHDEEGGGGPSEGGAAAGGSGGTSEACATFTTPTSIGSFEPQALNGPSGMVASRAHPGVLYAQLDAGDTARFFAVDTEGKLLGEFALEGATATDWEDVTVGACGAETCLYFGDFGDNAAQDNPANGREEIQIFRVPEPDLSVGQAAVSESLTNWEVIHMTYPDTAYNAETLMHDPITGDLIVMTKESSNNTTAFRLPADAAADSSVVLEQIAVVPTGPGSGQATQISGGDISPNGDRIAIRTYNRVFVWRRPAGASIADTLATDFTTLDWDTERQGEGVTFAADGNSLYLAGEQSNTLYQAVADCP